MKNLMAVVCGVVAMTFLCLITYGCHETQQATTTQYKACIESGGVYLYNVGCISTIKQ